MCRSVGRVPLLLTVDLYNKSHDHALSHPVASLEATSRYVPSTVLDADHVAASNPFVPVREYEPMLRVSVRVDDVTGRWISTGTCTCSLWRAYSGRGPL